MNVSTIRLCINSRSKLLSRSQNIGRKFCIPSIVIQEIAVRPIRYRGKHQGSEKIVYFVLSHASTFISITSTSYLNLMSSELISNISRISVYDILMTSG